MLALIESSRTLTLSRGWSGSAASFAVHSLLAAGAVWLTRPDVARGFAAPPREATVFWTEPAVATPPHVPGILPALPSVPARFALPSSIPVDVPPVALPGIGLPALPDTPPAVPGGRPGGIPGGAPVPAPRAPIDARYAEEPPVLIGHPPLRYPELLRQAGIEGSVTLEAVLDTAGHVEPATLRVVNATSALFETEARAVALGSRYRPARVSGLAVRVRILLPVTFTIRR